MNPTSNRRANGKAAYANYKKLEEFRESHTEKEVLVEGVKWSYYSCGQGSRVLLMLAGGMGVGEVFFMHMMELEKDFKLIVPNYPEVATIEKLMQGISAIIQQEGVASFNILGQSFGGVLAQELVRRFPLLIESAIISHSTTTSPPIDKSVIDSNYKHVGKTMQMLRIMPMGLMRILFKKRIAKILTNFSEEDRSFWIEYFSELVAKKTRSVQINLYKCMMDFMSNYTYCVDDLKGWQGRILILDSDEDKSISQPEREAVRALYPNTEVITFKNTGHLSIILEREQYLAIVKNFLNES